ncbi:MAG: VacB/RNase II family 3'-5' exoribonuclease [Polyangiaceae bacterium]|nr:VacB/RNase II family 3'-5' exoribonuclease [Polyangiaceae bacterium]
MTKNKMPRRDEVLALLAAQRPRTMHARELAKLLNVSEGNYLEFLELLEDLTFDRAVIALRGQRYGARQISPDNTPEHRMGRIQINARRFGFVSSSGFPDDVFVREGATAGAMHGDTVRVEITERTRLGFEGRVTEVLRRANTRVQGTLRKKKKNAWLEPDDSRIPHTIVITGDITEITGEDGDAAVVEITQFPQSADENPEAILIATLGTPGTFNVETQKILIRECIDESFSQAVQLEVNDVASTIDPARTSDREDLLGIPFMTIDPTDARDRDDAIFVRDLGDGHDDGYEAWVAIADVAEYVKPGTALDESARARGFSLYLPDRAVPMLPSTLSAKLCSLEKDEARLCIALCMRFDNKGRRTHTRLCEGVMKSRATLSYDQVAAGMRWSAISREQLDSNIQVAIDDASELARLLRRRRMRRGSLDIAVPEPQIILDPETGMPVDVVRRAQDPGVKHAYELIEELMIASNEAVAEWMIGKEQETIFRVHPPPSESKLEKLAAICESLKIPFEYEDASDPLRLGKFLRTVQEHPMASVIGTLALRSLAPASYDTVNVGHYGLASRAYSHFTSPIRRYPDLLVHRHVKGLLRHVAVDTDSYKDVSMECARREREIADVEREVSDVYRCSMMQSRVGMVGAGIVSDIGATSVTVTLDNPFVEVIVPEATLGLYGHERSEDGLHMVCPRTGDQVSLGDRMDIEVESSNMVRRVIYGKRIAAKHAQRDDDRRQDRQPKGTRRTIRDHRKSSHSAKSKKKTQGRRGGW